MEELVGTSEQLCAAVEVCAPGLHQGKKNQVGCQGCAGTLGHERRRLTPSLFMHVFFLHFIFFAPEMYIPGLRTTKTHPTPISLT